jgi:hypothetical protein
VLLAHERTLRRMTPLKSASVMMLPPRRAEDMMAPLSIAPVRARNR